MCHLFIYWTMHHALTYALTLTDSEMIFGKRSTFLMSARALKHLFPRDCDFVITLCSLRFRSASELYIDDDRS